MHSIYFYPHENVNKRNEPKRHYIEHRNIEEQKALQLREKKWYNKFKIQNNSIVCDKVSIFQ